MQLDNFSMYYIVLIRTHELDDGYDKGATQRDRILIMDRRWITAATAKEDYAASHSYRQQRQSEVVTGTATAAVLVGAVELNAYWLLGTTEGTATERAKQQKKRHTSKKKDKRSKKSKRTLESVTVGRLSSKARSWETDDEARYYQSGVVRYNSIGTAAPAAPAVVVGAHI